MRGGLALVLALGVGVLLGGCSAAGPVTDAEARIVASSLASAAKLAIESDDGARLCEVLAVDVELCASSWASWEADGSPMPDLDSVVVEVEPGEDGSQTLLYSGTYDGGGSFSSEVTVVATEDGPRAVDPVFWVDR